MVFFWHGFYFLGGGVSERRGVGLYAERNEVYRGYSVLWRGVRGFATQRSVRGRSPKAHRAGRGRVGLA